MLVDLLFMAAGFAIVFWSIWPKHTKTEIERIDEAFWEAWNKERKNYP